MRVAAMPLMIRYAAATTVVIEEQNRPTTMLSYTIGYYTCHARLMRIRQLLPYFAACFSAAC